MSARFPHLTKANNWPGLSTVDPFDLLVEFDPYLWTPDVTIHLARTALDPSYRDVGGWATAEERDAWYDSISDRELQVETEMHILPGVEIKLPYAFEVLQDYNQIFIDFPPTPTAGGNRSPRRFYYFLQDVQYRSPSSTACIITLDEWTTHMYDVDLTYIELDRGHAPMAAVTAPEFLANPMETCEYLTVPDDNYGEPPSRVRHTATDVLNRGPLYAVLVMTADPRQNPGTTGDTNWRTPSSNSYGVQGTMAYSTIAVEPPELSGLMSDMETQAPQVFATIMAAFLIPQRLCQIVESFTFVGHTVRRLNAVQVAEDMLTLTTDKFHYPTRYADIAKLYTSPYAVLDITDSEGRRQTIRIEDTTGQLHLSTIASIVYPMIGYDVYIMGIGGAGADGLTWSNFETRSMAAHGDWTATLRHYDIPVYAVVQDPSRAYGYQAYWDRVQKGSAIDESLRQSKLAAATQQSMTGAGLDRTLARMGQKQAQETEALNLSLTAQGVGGGLTPASSGSGVRGQMRQRVLGDMGDDSSLAAAAYMATQDQTYLSQAQAQARAQLAEKRDNITTAVALGGAVIAGGALIATVGPVYAAGGTMAAAMSTPASVAALTGFGGAIYQAAQEGMHLDGTMLQASQEQASFTMAATNSQALYQASTDKYMSKRNRMASTEDEINRISDQLRRDGLANQQTYETAIVQADVALSRTQAGTSKSLADNIAEGSATVNRLSLETDRRRASLDAPRVLSSMTGNSRQITGPTALSIQIRTQDAGAIAAAGDNFLRYGYRIGGRQWSLSNLTPMTIFTYWEGRIRLGAGDITSVTRETISRIFEAGTTIWRDPSRIGTASIYDNRRA